VRAHAHKPRIQGEEAMTVLITRDELREAIDTGGVTVVDALPAA
jgi:hypothetical protein